MRRIAVILARIALLCVLLAVSINVNASNDENAQKVTKIEDIRNLQTVDAKYLACDISDEQIEKMTTSELLQACMEYPMFGNIFAFSTEQIGYNELLSVFNGLRKLEDRNDTGSALIEYYRNLDLSDYPRKYEFGSIRFIYLQTITSQYKILFKMTPEERSLLFDLVYEKFNEISEKYSSTFSTKYSVLILSCILSINGNELDSKLDPSFNEFTTSGDFKAFDLDLLPPLQESLNFFRSRA